MKRKKIKTKRVVIISVLLILIIASLIFYFGFYNTTSQKLKRIGYSDKEIEFIEENLSNEEISIVLDNKYQKLLVDLVKNDNYDSSKLKTYFKDLNSSKSLSEIFETETKEEESKDDNESLEDPKSEIKNKFKNATYYIDQNLDRYLDYINLYPQKDVDEVIRSVNSNIDYEFYTHVTNTNLNDGNLILVNKYTKLDSSYIPDLVTMESGYTMVSGAKMTSEAYSHFKEMVNAAKNDGIKLYNISAYRSYQTQNGLYNNYANRDGKEAADTYSARPGYSEHQTGLALDINTASSSDHFENTKEYQWLINNSYKYGFILRYPQGKEYITGYKFEPWHYRYVGKEVAKYVHDTGVTYEEYYAYFLGTK